MDEGFDFTSLAAEDLDAGPETSGGKPRKYTSLAPFDGWYDQIAKTGKGKSVPMPAKHVKDAMAMTRLVAEERGKAVKFRLYAKGERINQADVVNLTPNTKVTLQFWAAEKRKNAPRQTAQVAETPAE